MSDRPADPTFTHFWLRPWHERLPEVMDLVRELSEQTSPQDMSRLYGQKMSRFFPADGRLSVSRRDLAYPWYRITRSHLYSNDFNPWSQRDTLKLLQGGVIGELLYSGDAKVIDDLVVPADDPAADHLAGFRSAIVLPLFENGVVINMVLTLSVQPNAFDPRFLPELLWLSNLFGRATSNLALSEELRRAYDSVDSELRSVADIQRSLLPRELPGIPGLKLAAHYQTSQRAGGDYYDFFELPGGQLGLLIADVSGHGTPAAVMMAVTHSIAHGHHGPPTPPDALLSFLNKRLYDRYTRGGGTFVTAFYAVYDPAMRELTYAVAGHNPPRLRRGDRVIALKGKPGFPLGVVDDETYTADRIALEPGDLLALYTDGITEARGSEGEQFEVERLDRTLLACDGAAEEAIDCVVKAVDDFTGHLPAGDDRTLLMMSVDR